jgi:hypothetical protein
MVNALTNQISNSFQWLCHLDLTCSKDSTSSSEVENHPTALPDN